MNKFGKMLLMMFPLWKLVTGMLKSLGSSLEKKSVWLTFSPKLFSHQNCFYIKHANFYLHQNTLWEMAKTRVICIIISGWQGWLLFQISCDKHVNFIIWKKVFSHTVFKVTPLCFNPTGFFTLAVHQGRMLNDFRMQMNFKQHVGSGLRSAAACPCDYG